MNFKKNYIQYFIDHPVTSLMIFIGLIFLGYYSIPHMRIGLLPNYSSPGVSIIVRYPGVAPEKMELIITKPIEEKISNVAGITSIQSLSKEGESKINVILNHQVSMKKKLIELQEKIEPLISSFPRETEKPYMIPYDPTNKPVYIVSLRSKKYDLKKLREIADKKLKYHFSRIDGVSEVFVSGGYVREIQILLDPLKMITYNLSFQSIMEILQKENVYIPAGFIQSDKSRYHLSIDAKFKNIDEIKNILIPYGDHKVVPFKSIAKIRDNYRERENISRTNGEDRVSLYIQKSGSGNTLYVSKESDKVLSKIQKEYKNINFYTDYNQGIFIQKAIDRVSSAVVLGGILVIIVLLSFLRNIPITIAIAIILPFSTISSFFFLYLMGVEINVMTLSGLALGAGLLIDNTIVVSEKIDFLEGSSSDIKEIIIQAVSSVYSELIASTMTTIIVFFPLVFADHSTRILYMNLALTITISLILSLFSSFSIFPSLIYFLKRNEEKINEPLNKIQRYISLPKKISNFSLLNRLNDQKEKLSSLQKFIMDKYKFLLFFGIKRVYLLTTIIIIFLLVGYLSFNLSKKEYIDPIDSGEITATGELDVGLNLEATEKKIKYLEEQFLKIPMVEKVNSKIEKWHSVFSIKMKESYRNSVNTDEFIEILKKPSSKVKDIFVHYNRANDTGGDKEIDIEIFGEKIDELKKIAKDLAKTIQNKIYGIDRVLLRFRDGKPAIDLSPGIIETSRIGYTNSQLGQLLRGSLFGMVTTKYYDQNREIDVRMKIENRFLNNPKQLMEFYLPQPEAGFVPLRSLVSAQKTKENTRIYRKNKRRMVSITVKLANIDTGKAGELIQKLLYEFDLPANYTASLGEKYKKQKKNQWEMVFITSIALILIYFLLGSLFQSLTEPLFIILTVPLSIFYVVILIFLIKNTLNISVYIGFILTGGIVVNNAILIISTIKTEIKNSNIIQSVYDSVIQRTRPIMMTTITTVAGMAPLLFDYSTGSNLWRPLAFTVIHGLLFSLWISLYIIPILYIKYKMYLQKRENQA